MLSGYKALKRLARERPTWIPIVESCLEEVQQANGEFAGTWVLERAKEKGKMRGRILKEREKKVRRI